jgi:hypothetical protein
MTAAYFEDHPTDPEKVILRKPSLDQGAGYERGFVDGMQYQMQSSVDKAVNAMSQRTWVGLTNNELQPIADEYRILFGSWVEDFARAIEAKLKEKNT